MMGTGARGWRLVLLLIAICVYHFWTTCHAHEWRDKDHGSACTVDSSERACRAGSHINDSHDQHILFISIAIKGHAQPLLRIAKEMNARGYRVTFATHESGREWVTSHSVPFLSAGAFPISADDLRTKLKTMTWDSSNFRGILTMFNDIYVAAARPMFDELLPHLQTQPPALIVMDIASIGAQDLAHKLRIPYVVNSPSIMFDLGGTPSYVPAWGTGYSARMSLWSRCMNILFPRLLSVALTPPFMQLNKMRWELELKPYRSQHDIFKGARVILNTAFGLEYPQPLSPLIEPVGAILPMDFNKSQPQLGSMLSSWFERRTTSKSQQQHLHGAVVYLNLGTMSYIDAWQADALVDGLTMRAEEAQIKVLWVLPSDQRNVLPAHVPPNFKVKSPNVVPSLDVLAHPAVQVVVSHCGMVSAQEALVHGKPLLCIPFHVDQPDVAARVVDAGAGLSLDKNTLSAAQVHDAVVQLLSNPSYTSNAKRVGKLLERAGGTARAIEIIDATLRLGTTHLDTIDLSQPWHKTAMVDVWTVYAALFCVCALVIRVLWLCVYFVVSESWAFVGNVVFGSGEPMDAAVASLSPPPPPQGSETTEAAEGDEEENTATTSTTEPTPVEAAVMDTSTRDVDALH